MAVIFKKIENRIYNKNYLDNIRLILSELENQKSENKKQRFRIAQNIKKLKIKTTRLGFNLGLIKGYQKSLKQLGNSSASSTHIERYVKDMTKVAKAIIEKVIIENPEIVTNYLEENIKDILSNINKQDNPYILAHPDEIEILKLIFDNVLINEDPEIRLGSVKIITDAGIIDLDFNANLNILLKKLSEFSTEWLDNI
jgi:flagellar biosynthesis/type III secretory pathway protein FliH